MIEESLRTYLSTDSAVAALIIDESASPPLYKVYGVMAPQGVKPTFLVFAKAGAYPTDGTYCATDAVRRCVFQFDSYSRTFIEALMLARAVKGALENFQGDMYGTHVSSIVLESEFQMTDPEPGLFRVSMTFLIWYAE